ncbi:hypothetical protein SC10_B2orf04376 [Bacillus paralicheniformis]|nr:hypothetical protein SC10_B2orf04376 [Bacillus paralicheniformis]
MLFFLVCSGSSWIPPFSFQYKQNNVIQNIIHDYGTEEPETEVRTLKLYRHFFVPPQFKEGTVCLTRQKKHQKTAVCKRRAYCLWGIQS